MRIFYLAFFLLFSSTIFGQQNDCINAQVVCINENIVFNPNGAGIDDFANPNNSSGCLATGEHSSAWYYFEIEATAPPNQTLDFAIDPTGGAGQDYDFAVFGPNLPCSNLGSPIRCSYAGPGCAFCPSTGVGNGTNDLSEGAGGDGFVMSLTVQPGEGYFLLVDNFANNGIGFNLSWSGSALDDLDCNAEIPCDLIADAGTNQSACSGDSNITLSGSANGSQGGETYSWVGSNGSTAYLDNPNSSNPTVTIPSGVSGTFDFTLTVNESDCTDDAMVSLTVNPLPIVTVNGPPSLCDDAQVATITGLPSGGTWSPNAPNGFFDPSSSGSGPHIIEYTYTDNNGCSDMATTTINVNPSPIVSIQPFNTNLCTEDNPITLNGSPAGGTWSGDVNNGAIFPSLLGVGSYSVTYSFTNAEGCSDMTTTNFTIFPNPDVVIQDPGVLCENGNPVILQATPSGGTWGGNGTGGVFDPGNFPPGTYPVTYTAGQFNCNTEETINIQVTAAPFVLMDQIPDLCTSSPNFTIGANPPGGTWGSSTPGGVINPSNLGSGNHVATYTYTSAQGCTVTSPQSFSILEPPSVSITPIGDLCAGGLPQTLTGTPSGGTWSSNAPGGVFDPSSATPGTYTVTYTYTDQNTGCDGSDDLSIQVVDGPSVTITGNNTFCDNSTNVLGTTGTFNNYVWSNGGTSSSISITTQGTYTVTVTDGSGCTGTDQISVSILPELAPTVSGNTSVCQGINTSLTVDGTYSTYQWSNAQSTNSISVGAGTYTVTVTDATGCTGSEVVNVISNNSPTPTMEGTPSFCNGGSTTLNTQTFSGYQWSNNTSGSFINVTTAGTYTVTVTDTNGCTGTIDQVVTENTAEVPMFSGNTSFCIGESITLSTVNSYNNYSWSTGDDSPFVIVSQSGMIGVTITDANGCQNENSVMITESPSPNPEIMGNTTFCNNANTTLSLPSNFTDYVWSNGTSNNPITVTQAGTFTVTVTDANGCTGVDQISVAITPELEPTVSGGLSICDGTNTTLTVDGTYVDYIWSNSETTSSVSLGMAGTYTVTVTDASGCTGSESVVINTNSTPTVTINGIPNFCTGGSTDLNTEVFDEYIWSSGETVQQISVSTAGTYTVTVTDSNGCTAETQLDVLENTIAPPTITGDLAYCAGNEATLTAEGNFSSYIWTTGETTNSISVAQTGNIGVTVTDANGCESEQSVMLTENALPTPMIVGATNICNNATTILDASDPNITSYMWSNGQTTSSILVDQAGTYSVDVTDVNGCVGTNQVTVSITAELEPTLSGIFEFCDGGTGLVEAEAGYDSYLWSDMTNGQSISPTTSGTYTVTVTDATGCTGSAEMDVTEFDIPEPQISGSTSFCTGSSTTLDVPGTWSSFIWSESSTTSSITVSSPGTYTVTVTDAAGCEGTASVDIEESTSLNPVIVGNLGFCPNGTTPLDAGVGFSTYVWSNGETGQIINVGTVGDFTVTVSDASGCMGTATASVLENVPPALSIIGQASFCTGSNTTLNAGDDFDSYIWSNGETTQMLTVDQAGTYTVTVTDTNGCAGESFIDVQELANLDPAIDGPTDLCEGTTISIAAATGFETYAWSDGVTTTESIEITSAGSYTVTVTDANGCDGEETYIISENANPQPTILGEEAFCPTESTSLSSDGTYTNYEWSDGTMNDNIVASTVGTYTLTVTDANGCIGIDEIIITELIAPSTIILGTPSFCPNENTILDGGNGFADYIWSNGATSQMLTVDQAGTYTVTVTNAEGCTNLAQVMVEENVPPSPVINGATSFCSDLSTTLDATGNYTNYLWSDNSTDPTLEVDESGTYAVTVTDANGCQGMTEVTVTETTSLLPAITGTPNFCPNETTLIQAELGYDTYEWSDGTMDSELSVSLAGTYTVTVTDASGCQGTNEVDVLQNTPPTPNVLGSATFCTGFSSTLSVDGVYDTYVWSDNSTDPTLEVNADGIYFVTVTDANGCTGVNSLQVTESAELQPSIQAPPSFCTGTTATLDAGVGFETYTWSDNSNGQTLEVNTPGIYTVTVSDVSGCEGETFFEIMEDSPVNAGVANAPNSYCSVDITLVDLQNELVGADANGQWTEISTNPSTGTGFNPTMGEFNTANQLPGTYTFEYFIPANGACASDLATVSVIVEETPVAAIEPAIILDCNNPTTALDASNSMGGNDLTYTWNTSNGVIDSGGNSPNPTISADGDYELTISLPNGCFATSSITISENFDSPDADAGAAQQLTCADGQATLNGNSTTTGVIYIWTGPGIFDTNMNDQNPTVTVSGTYTLTTTNPINGCISAVSSVMVEDNLDAPTFMIDPVGLLNCDNTSQIISGPFSTDFTYQWFLDGNIIPGATSDVFEATQPGLYSLQITNTNNGCNSTEAVEVIESIDPPTAEAGNADLITCDASTISLNGNGSSTGTEFSYEWLDGNNNTIPNSNSLTIDINQPGNYTLIVTNTDNGCTATDVVNVAADTNFPVADAGQNATLDCDFNSIQIGGNSSTGNTITYLWTTSNGGTITNPTSLNASISTPGTYQLQVTDTSNDCVSIDDIVVVENTNIPQEVEYDLSPISCNGESDGAFSIVDIIGGTAPYQFAFDGGSFSDVSAFPFLGAGEYNLIVQDALGCQLQTQIALFEPIPFILDLGEDQTIELGQEAQINGQSSLPIDSLLWQLDPSLPCVDCLDPRVSPSITTTYEATAVDINGCVDTDDITIFVEKNRHVFIPNVFTPNDDGVNDLFNVFGGDDVEKIHVLKVYNRWGEVMYEHTDFLPNDLSVGWDGYFKGKKMNPGVFVYFAEIEFKDGFKTIYKGDVALRK